jgi:uncharacterized damage-inducible protein DinB
MSTTGRFLATLLETALDRDPWYGLSTSSWLSGLAAAQAADHPVAACHSIWEIVLHMISWQREVARRLTGADPAEPLEGDWPPVGPVTDEGWAAARRSLSESTRAAADAMRAVEDHALSALVGGATRNVALGTGVKQHELIVGLLQHNAYHSGQITLLRKALEAGASNPEGA